ncbi:hypothetical protein NQ318_008585 [Aromia moschata]|uniref:SHSP domain-containing protein n=1 Tax=Aromia moschata TaxID=1265417 RepID=A0AAV8YXU9_9CUCU|nr:hypothetical protein NQ318_008585 [Aromia moschata]
MSLIPWLDDPFIRPSRHRGRQVELWRDPESYVRAYLPRNFWDYPLEELRNLSALLQNTGASVNFDKDKFQANIDVQQFKPEEISVKVTGDNTVTIEGKHEEKPDEHGYISRHFVRKYVLPENCDIKQVQSKLSSDGVLTITAPKVEEDKKVEHREIPVTQTGQPVKGIEQKASSEEPKKSELLTLLFSNQKAREMEVDDFYADQEARGQIGDPGIHVQIDESKFGRRKYNRGRLVEGHWVLGIGVEHSKDFRMVVQFVLTLSKPSRFGGLQKVIFMAVMFVKMPSQIVFASTFGGDGIANISAIPSKLFCALSAVNMLYRSYKVYTG